MHHCRYNRRSKDIQIWWYWGQVHGSNQYKTQKRVNNLHQHHRASMTDARTRPLFFTPPYILRSNIPTHAICDPQSPEKFW